jgi:hypothetical protein
MISLTKRINGQILEPLFHSLVYQLVYIFPFNYSQNFNSMHLAARVNPFEPERVKER